MLPDNPKHLTQAKLRKIIRQTRYNQNFSVRESDKFDFTAIDEYARSAPDDVRSDAKTLSAYLIKPAKNDWEKIRAIYTWLISHLEYDMRVYRGYRTPVDPGEVLRSGIAACSGFSNLFGDLAKSAGLEACNVPGYGKGYGYLENKEINTPNHEWNVVRIDKKWHIFEATWGAGSVKNGMYYPTLDYYWFDTPPEEFIFTHLPQDPVWQLITEPLLLIDFEKMPRLLSPYFRAGFSGQDAFSCLGPDLAFDFPVVYDTGTINFQIIKSPMSGVLNQDEVYYFLIYAAGMNDMMIKNGTSQIVVKPKNGYFATLVTAEAGELKICLPKPGSKRYLVLVKYKVN